MRTVLGLIGLVIVVVLAVLAWNWWANNSSQVAIIYPTEGAALAGNSVPVRLSADPNFKKTLVQPDNQMELITYLDGKEVSRGKALEYNLTDISPGQHRLEVGLSDQNKQSGISLHIMPKPVSFTLGGGSGASSILPPGVTNGLYSTVPQNQAEVSSISVPAAEVAASAPKLAPATGLGGLQAASIAKQPASAPVELDARTAAIANGSNSQLLISKTQVDPQAIAVADQSRSIQMASEPAMMTFFRWLIALYIAGFVVALGVVILRGRPGQEQAD